MATPDGSPAHSPRGPSCPGAISSLLVLTAESESFAKHVGLDEKASRRFGALSDDQQSRARWDETRTDIRNPSAYMARKCAVLEKESVESIEPATVAAGASAGVVEGSSEAADVAEGAEMAEGTGTATTASFTEGDKLEPPSIVVAEGSYEEAARYFGVDTGEDNGCANNEEGHDEDPWPDEDNEGYEEYGEGDENWPDDDAWPEEEWE